MLGAGCRLSSNARCMSSAAGRPPSTHHCATVFCQEGTVGPLCCSDRQLAVPSGSGRTRGMALARVIALSLATLWLPSRERLESCCEYGLCSFTGYVCCCCCCCAHGSEACLTDSIMQARLAVSSADGGGALRPPDSHRPTAGRPCCADTSPAAWEWLFAGRLPWPLTEVDTLGSWPPSCFGVASFATCWFAPVLDLRARLQRRQQLCSMSALEGSLWKSSAGLCVLQTGQCLPRTAGFAATWPSPRRRTPSLAASLLMLSAHVGCWIASQI